jgi:hypothetical protein
MSLELFRANHTKDDNKSILVLNKWMCGVGPILNEEKESSKLPLRTCVPYMQNTQVMFLKFESVLGGANCK